MSLYTWLGNGSYGNEIPIRYARGYERDCSNPQCGLNWGNAYEGATFLTVNLQETYDVSQIKSYVLSLLDDKTAGLVDEITARVEEKMRNNVNMTVEAAIASTFIEMSEEQVLNIIREEKENGEAE